ncbi:MAG: hypothetical protein H6718_03280 [Polyangiaceae bacterium]|nr:hypothetical protein [Polyangiaceae bacterium]
MADAGDLKSLAETTDALNQQENSHFGSRANDQRNPNGQVGVQQSGQVHAREQLLSALAEALRSGDLTVARIAHRALGQLLDGADPGAVVDLATERRKRGES